MFQIRVERFGPPSVVAQCVRQPDEGSPSAWEVIVKIQAFPINPADLAMLSGRYGVLPKPPSGIGIEGAGVVIECGSSVQNVQPGDRVMVVANDNWTQLKKVPSSLVHKIRDEIDLVTAASLKVNFATAFLLLNDYVKLKPGAWIIQNAPMSNVGRLVIQMARSLKLKTVNLVRRPEAVDEVLEFGGDIAVEVSDETAQQVKEKIGKSKIKLGLDAVGGLSTGLIADCLTDKSKILTYGMLSNEPCQIHPSHLVFRQIEHQGFWLSKRLNRYTHEQRDQLYDQVSELVIEHEIEPKFDRSFTIQETAEAIRYSEQGLGKAIVFPNGAPSDSRLAKLIPVHSAALVETSES